MAGFFVKICKKTFQDHMIPIFNQQIFLLFCVAKFLQIMSLINLQHIKSWVIPSVLLLLLMGCEREYLFRGDEAGVRFSVDTVRFDTIFTDLGSATKNFKIYNPSSQDMVIEAIQLAGGDQSNYRININGEPVDFITDVRLKGRDSLFVFVDVSINPSGENAPFFVNDSILIYTQQRLQSVQLVAYGQDVVRLTREKLKSQRLTKDKPYLITDYVEVDSLQTLTIEAGTQLYFGNDASLIVYGSLVVNGTLEEPVLFAGARREAWYKDKPGQWGHIQLMPGSGESMINYAHIRNSKFGLVIDSVGLGDKMPVRITNSRIEHISGYGIIAQNAGVEVGNCLIANCGKSLAALTVGGRYDFTHCTLANFYGWSFRTHPSLLISNYYLDKRNNPVVAPIERATFKNCIVYGRNETELLLDLKKDETLAGRDNISFVNCLVKVPKSFDMSDGSMFRQVIRDEDPKFVKPLEYNFQLDTLSVAKDVGNIAFSQAYPLDILGKSRFEDDSCDMGAYERVEKK